MDYQKIYDNIVERAKSRVKPEIFEVHHIIPRCVGGVDAPSNLVELTPREHYICHQLLCKIYPKNRKLLYAARFMTVHNTNNRSKNREYGWLREKFVEMHPCKDPGVRERISKSLLDYYASEEYHDVSLRRREKYREIRACKCGCGEEFVAYKKERRLYLNSSHAPKPDYNKVSSSLRKKLSSMDEESMRDRMRNSLGSCDHKKRGENISLSKRGKKTNQQQIMGIKYAKMSDDDFALFVSNKTEPVKKRMHNLRLKWKNS